MIDTESLKRAIMRLDSFNCDIADFAEEDISEEVKQDLDKISEMTNVILAHLVNTHQVLIGSEDDFIYNLDSYDEADEIIPFDQLDASCADLMDEAVGEY